MKIELLNNNGKQWQKIDDNYIKGFAFIEERLLCEESIIKELLLSITNKKVAQKLVELNGNFSAIIQHEGTTYLFADKLKSYPVLFARINDEWIITDQSRVVMDSMARYEPNEDAIMTYLALGYLHGNDTFLNDCKIVSAGTYVELTDKAIVNKYHNHIYEKINVPNNQIMEHCMQTLESAIKRMVLSIGDRPIWIPLSGGYDSRLLACVCKKLNLQQVSCFTYGISESYEIGISKRVAETLGFPWFYVEYTEEKFIKLTEDPMDIDYIYWAMNLNTTSHFQDFIAFKELRDKGIIPDNAVIVPGHSGEILGRDQVPYHLLDNGHSVADLLYHRYFQWNTLKEKYKKRVLANLGTTLNSTITKDDKPLAIDLFTNWNIQNRQANFIVNAVRVYEYFGIDWRIPLWDDELSKFWFSLEWEVNSDVKLYNQFMFEKYFIPMNVAIYKESGASKSLMARVRLPFGIKNKIKNILTKLKYFKSRYDHNGFNYRANYYSKKLQNFQPSFIVQKKINTNALIAIYQLFLLEEYFKKGSNS